MFNYVNVFILMMYIQSESYAIMTSIATIRFIHNKHQLSYIESYKSISITMYIGHILSTMYP